MSGQELFDPNAVRFFRLPTRTAPVVPTIDELVTNLETGSCNADDVIESSTPEVLALLAMHHQCPNLLLLRLAQNVHEQVRAAVAANPNIDDECIWLLTSDESSMVRVKLACNQALPAFALEMLSEDEHPLVASRADRTLSRRSHPSGIDKVIHWFFTPELKQAG